MCCDPGAYPSSSVKRAAGRTFTRQFMGSMCSASWIIADTSVDAATGTSCYCYCCCWCWCCGALTCVSHQSSIAEAIGRCRARAGVRISRQRTQGYGRECTGLVRIHSRVWVLAVHGCRAWMCLVWGLRRSLRPRRQLQLMTRVRGSSADVAAPSVTVRCHVCTDRPFDTRTIHGK